MIRARVICGLGCLVASVAQAETRREGLSRGLSTYTARGEGGRMTLVCDPERVYTPGKSHGSFVVVMPVDKSATQIVFLAATGTQAAFDVQDGIAAQQQSDAQDWAALIDMIAAGGRIAVVTAQDAFTLDMAPIPDLACD